MGTRRLVVVSPRSQSSLGVLFPLPGEETLPLRPSLSSGHNTIADFWELLLTERPAHTSPSPPPPSRSWPPPVLQLMTNRVSSVDEILVTSGGDRIGHSLQRAEDPVSKSSSAKQRLPAMAIGDSQPAVEHPNMVDEPIINGVVRASAAECSNAKKRKKSDIWDHFTVDITNKKACCNYCGKSLIHTSNYGTSSLRKHLKKCPAKTGTEMRQTQLAANEVAGSSNEMIVTKFDQAQIRENISRYIVICELPLSTVEQPAFREMLGSLQPEFMPYNELAALIDVRELYNKEKKILQDVMLKVKGRISLAISAWTGTEEDFMIITAHYTDDEWELKRRVIGFGDDEHTFAYDWDEIQSNLIEWGITYKLFSVVPHNFARAIVIPSTFNEQCESSLPLGGRFFLIGRSAFDIDVTMKRFRKSDSVSRINDAIDFVSSSQERQNLFHDCQRTVSLDKIHMRLRRIDKASAKYRFLYGCPHENWKLVIHYKDAFTHFHSVENFKHPPTEEDWSIVTELCNFEKVIDDSEGMLAENSTSGADVRLYQFCMFGSHFRKDRVSSLTKEIWEKVNFNQNWDDYCIMVSIVVAFDPRKKLDFVKFCFSKAYDDTATKYVDDVKNSLANLFNWYKEKLRLQPSNVPNNDGNGSCIALVSNNRSNVLREFHRFKQNENRSQPPENELDSYLQEEAWPDEANFNILKWWQVNGSKYPTLAVMARDILAIPFDTVDSNVDCSIVKKYLHLRPSMTGALVCLKDWLRQSYFSNSTSGLRLDDTSVDKHCDSSGEESSSQSADEE